MKWAGANWGYHACGDPSSFMGHAAFGFRFMARYAVMAYPARMRRLHAVYGRWCITWEMKRMYRSRHTDKIINANQDSKLSPVAPEVLRTSRGADALAFVALRAPLRQTQRLSEVRLFCYTVGHGIKSKWSIGPSSSCQRRRPRFRTRQRRTRTPQRRRRRWTGRCTRRPRTPARAPGPARAAANTSREGGRTARKEHA